MATQDVKIRITALDKTSTAFKKIGTGLRALTKPLFSMKTALAGLLGAGGFTLLVRQSLLATDALSKTANKIGTTTEALSKLQFAAKLSGVETSTLNMAMQRFTRRLSEAARGTGEAQGALRELNIDARELQQMPLDDQMLALSRAFGEVGTESDKVRLAFKLFDSEGVALVNMLKQGEIALNGFFEEAEAVGIVMSQQAAKGVEKANDEFLILSSIFKGILDQTVAALAPALEYIVTSLSDTLKAFGDVQGGFAELGKDIAIRLIDGVQAGAKGVILVLNKIIEAVNSTTRALASLTLTQDRYAARSAERQLELLDEQQAAFKRYHEIRYKDGEQLTKREYRLFTRAQEQGLITEQDYADKRAKIEADLAEKRATLRNSEAAVAGKKGIPKIEELLGFTQEELDALFADIKDKVRDFNLVLGEPPKTPEMNLPNKYIQSLKDLKRTLPETQDLVVSFANNTMNSFTQGFTDAITGAEKFSDAIRAMAKSVVDDLIRMAVQYYITQRIFGAIVNAFTPAAPKGMDGNPAGPKFGPQVPDFNGGGFTGYGARAGGVDGKGGFPAILHPNESVIDHTKGQAGGVTIVQNINVTTGVQQTVRAEIANLLPQISNAAKSAVADARLRGGGFSKAMVGA